MTGNREGFDRSAAITRSLLGYGIVAGPFYLIVGVAQAVMRDGFDLQRHALSLLANGPGGWVQTANFALTGAMVIAAAVGFARVLGPKTRGVVWCLSAYGFCMILASMFTADPVDGFPIGTPLGMPTTISTFGLLHFAVGTLGFVFLAISSLFAARVMGQRGERTLALFSWFTGPAVLIGFFGGIFIPGLAEGTMGIWFAVVIGWIWLAVLSRHLYRVAPDPNCAPPSS